MPPITTAPAIVVGSGPAGVACADGLLEKGAKVLMLDAGVTLEPARQEAVARLAAVEPEQWDPNMLSVLKENMEIEAGGIPEKLVYGSNFPYRDEHNDIALDLQGVGLKPSLARGGLSNVWGAALMPYRDADLADWPIKTAELAEHYAGALKLTGLSAARDELAEYFPLHHDDPGSLNLSRQAAGMHEKMERHRANLREQGIHSGRARVAIKAANTDPGCVHCGLCMYGCPYGYIYSSSETVTKLQKNERFTYQPDVVVTGLAEREDGVTVRGRNRVSRGEVSFEACRVYLAAGAAPTTKLLLESRGDYDRTLMMQDSQYFLIPMILSKRAPNIHEDKLYTLSQLFLEIFDEKISAHTVHLQIYTYSQIIGGAIRKSLGRFGMNFEYLARQLESRLVIGQGFLHSADSSRIATTLRRGPAPCLELKGLVNPEARRTVKRVVAKLGRHARSIGARPLGPMVQVAEPGRSFHSGGTFPMRRKPGPFESDLLGRPLGWNRVHAVDATVLPSIPATTITLSVMANARRIAWESAGLT